MNVRKSNPYGFKRQTICYDNILMSMKPEYADMILHGSKKYEFRKHGFKREIDKVFIYATKPVSKIVGYFTFDEILRGTTSEIWETCSEYAGILENDFHKYFKSTKTAFAIRINRVFKMEKPISPSNIIEGFKGPRSFIYINSKISGSIGRSL